jgi:hypothetical protein
MYGKGKLDLVFVSYYTVVLSFAREFIMQQILRPIAIKAGLKSKAKQYRFMEQVYTAIYMAIFGTFGVYVMSQGPLWYFNTRTMFEGFPHRKHEGIFKAYYLLQTSYWSQPASNCAAAPAGEAAERFQRAGLSPYCHPGPDILELPFPLHPYEYRGVHHSRHQ